MRIPPYAPGGTAFLLEYILKMTITKNLKNPSWETGSFNSFGLFESEVSTVIEEKNIFRKRFIPEQNRPNFFKPNTLITFHIPSAGRVQLLVYNFLGQEVERIVDSYLPAGAHFYSFNGGTLASGVYFYCLHCSEFTSTRKMLLLK